jgi:hypothetical protein
VSAVKGLARPSKRPAAGMDKEKQSIVAPAFNQIEGLNSDLSRRGQVLPTRLTKSFALPVQGPRTSSAIGGVGEEACKQCRRL